jgi:phage terminase Nu1 subunit (DNA packaging protein)
MTGMPLRAAAKVLQVDPSTLQRYLRKGCPSLRKGRRGPGNSALVDLRQVRAWLGPASAPDPDMILRQIAEALVLALTEDRADMRAETSQAIVAAAFYVAFERCCTVFGHRYRSDENPIRALLPFL